MKTEAVIIDVVNFHKGERKLRRGKTGLEHHNLFRQSQWMEIECSRFRKLSYVVTSSRLAFSNYLWELWLDIDLDGYLNKARWQYGAHWITFNNSWRWRRILYVLIVLNKAGLIPYKARWQYGVHWITFYNSWRWSRGHSTLE